MAAASLGKAPAPVPLGAGSTLMRYAPFSRPPSAGDAAETVQPFAVEEKSSAAMTAPEAVGRGVVGVVDVPVTGAPNSDVVKTTAAVRTAAAAPTASAIRARRRRIGAALSVTPGGKGETWLLSRTYAVGMGCPATAELGRSED
jgi:hypothetical protein